MPVWLDLWARMRGWGPAFEALRPAVADAGPATVVGTSRTVLAHAAYHWRGLDIKLVAYNPDGGVDSHFELVSRWPPALSENETVWLVSDGEFPAELLAAFNRVDAASEARPRRADTQPAGAEAGACTRADAGGLGPRRNEPVAGRRRPLAGRCNRRARGA